jgi:hypothetical protein
LRKHRTGIDQSEPVVRSFHFRTSIYLPFVLPGAADLKKSAPL